MNKFRSVIETIKYFFRTSSKVTCEQEDIYLLKLYEVCKAIRIGIGYIDKPIPNELVKDIDEPIASYLRWTRFHMTKQQLAGMFADYGTFHFDGLQTIIDNKEPELPCTSLVLKLIRQRNKLEAIEEDFK